MFKRVPFSRRTFLGATLLGGGAAMVSPAFIDPAHARLRPVDVFMGTTPDYANVWAALQKGYFAKEGLEVNIRLFPSGSAASDAFRAGQAEFLCCGDVPAVRLWKVTGTRYIAPVSRDYHSLVLVVRSDIKSAKDIKGKVLATQTGSSVMAMFGLINKHFGLEVGDYKITNMEPSDMVIALEGRSIDGFLWASPFEQRALEVSGDKVHVLLRGTDVGYPNAVGLITRPDLIENERPMIQGFVRALTQASDWCMANKDETSEIMTKVLKIDINTAQATQVMEFTTKFDQALYKYLSGLSSWMLENGLIDKPMDWENYFDFTFLKSIDPSRVEPMKDAY